MEESFNAVVFAIHGFGMNAADHNGNVSVNICSGDTGYTILSATLSLTHALAMFGRFCVVDPYKAIIDNIHDTAKHYDLVCPVYDDLMSALVLGGSDDDD